MTKIKKENSDFGVTDAEKRVAKLSGDIAKSKSELLTLQYLAVKERSQTKEDAVAESLAQAILNAAKSIATIKMLMRGRRHTTFRQGKSSYLLIRLS